MDTNWLGETPLNIARAPHPLPRNPKRYLPIYAPMGGNTTEEHVVSFKYSLRILNIQHEDVAYRLFPFTLQDATYD